MNIVESFVPTAATMGSGFFAGVLIGYALKKVIKIVAIIIGLFLGGLEYLRSQQISTTNWNKLQTLLEGAITTLANLTMQIPDISANNSIDSHAAITSLAMTSLDIR